MTRNELREKAYSFGRDIVNKDWKGDLIFGDIEYYFDESGTEIGHVVFPLTKHESIKMFEGGRKWGKANYDKLHVMVLNAPYWKL